MRRRRATRQRARLRRAAPRVFVQPSIRETRSPSMHSARVHASHSASNGCAGEGFDHSPPLQCLEEHIAGCRRSCKSFTHPLNPPHSACGIWDFSPPVTKIPTAPTAPASSWATTIRNLALALSLLSRCFMRATLRSAGPSRPCRHHEFSCTLTEGRVGEIREETSLWHRRIKSTPVQGRTVAWTAVT